jgi:predicted ABC-type exoprotein transport system permease subunit
MKTIHGQCPRYDSRYIKNDTNYSHLTIIVKQFMLSFQFFFKNSDQQNLLPWKVIIKSMFREPWWEPYFSFIFVLCHLVTICREYLSSPPVFFVGSVLLIFLILLVPCCDVRYDFHLRIEGGSGFIRSSTTDVAHCWQFLNRRYIHVFLNNWRHIAIPKTLGHSIVMRFIFTSNCL